MVEAVKPVLRSACDSGVCDVSRARYECVISLVFKKKDLSPKQLTVTSMRQICRLFLERGQDVNQQRVSSYQRGHGQGLMATRGLPTPTPSPETGPGKCSVTLGSRKDCGEPRKENKGSRCAPTAGAEARIEGKLTWVSAFEFFFFFL